MINTFRRILIASWIFVLGSVVLLALFPKLATKIPYPAAIRPFLLALILISSVYGVVSIYRRGMGRAKRQP